MNVTKHFHTTSAELHTVVCVVVVPVETADLSPFEVSSGENHYLDVVYAESTPVFLVVLTKVDEFSVDRHRSVQRWFFF